MGEVQNNENIASFSLEFFLYLSPIVGDYKNNSGIGKTITKEARVWESTINYVLKSIWIRSTSPGV